jgi:hypothetical protein
VGKDTTCGVCTDTQTDPFHCGTGPAPGGCKVCHIGAGCAAGACQACPPADPDVCGAAPGTCVNETNDPANCGGCGIACTGGTTCDTGKCCAPSQENCGGTCSDPQTDNANCGTCGNACMGGTTCQKGVCICDAGEKLCGGTCTLTTVDPSNCGGCGNVCGTGANAGKPYCVSNGCSASCPAPLIPCGTGATAECTDPKDDDNNCGACGNKCAAGMGCSAGNCVPAVMLNPPPAGKCDNGGPPIIVPTGGGGSDCAGNLGTTTFTFGLCSETNVGTMSKLIAIDAFDSTLGPYTPGGIGGGMGVNGFIDNSAAMTIGGDLYVSTNVAGEPNPGESFKGNVTVNQRFFDGGALHYTSTITVAGGGHCSISTTVTCTTQPPALPGHLGSCPGTETCVGLQGASVQGPWSTTGGNADMIVAGSLLTGTANCTTSLPPNPSHLSFGTCAPGTVSVPKPCEDDPAKLIPVRAIVDHFATTNDNALIGLNQNLLDNPGSTIRLDLPCGYYYLNSINGSHDITIVVHGHTGLFIGGSMRVSQQLILDLDPGATLDMFVGGVLNASGAVILGSPAYPRESRLYFGSGSCAGSGGCSDNADCCSGQCNAGTCVSSGGLISQAVGLSNSGNFNGLIYAGYGEFFHSGSPMEMYGAIFTQFFDASGETTIHYDNATQAPNECPSPQGQPCEGCGDCNNQACTGTPKKCGACSADTDCCAPLHCENPGPSGVCKL